ncbi:MAG: polyphosphate kinase 1, partial [Bacteroidota bacterium]
LGKEHLRYDHFSPVSHPRINNNESVFDIISKKDLMLHFPYQTFNHYINWLREASMDPAVIAIRTTLYRVARNSAVINALINAALNGKQVIVNIELQARFDEKSNIYWSKKLEEAGVRVTFGIQGLKVHSKLTLISREENGELAHYGAVGTGNFHEGTANVYSDLLMLTKNREINEDIWKVFDFFDNTYRNYSYKHLIVSPNFQRRKLSTLIDGEIKNAQRGREAYIILKINSLVDQEMIKKLYEANNAGVKVKLIVRGICSLIPGVPGQSENIEAISIVDKYLEHSRIFVFANGGDELYYISSADWMTRNLDHRIEVSSPVFDKDIQKELMDIINIQLNDNVKARIIDEKNSNKYKKTRSSDPVRSQIELCNYYNGMSESKK